MANEKVYAVHPIYEGEPIDEETLHQQTTDAVSPFELPDEVAQAIGQVSIDAGHELDAALTEVVSLVEQQKATLVGLDALVESYEASLPDHHPVNRPEIDED